MYVWINGESKLHYSSGHSIHAPLVSISMHLCGLNWISSVVSWWLFVNKSGENPVPNTPLGKPFNAVTVYFVHFHSIYYLQLICYHWIRYACTFKFTQLKENIKFNIQCFGVSLYKTENVFLVLSASTKSCMNSCILGNLLQKSNVRCRTYKFLDILTYYMEYMFCGRLNEESR